MSSLERQHETSGATAGLSSSAENTVSNAGNTAGQASSGTPRYWRSLAELADAPEYRAFLDAEFPAADDPQGLSRRRWLQLMASSLALAGVTGVTGCRWEKREIRPFAKRPADRVPGEPQQFATTMDIAGSALGLLVTCVNGRPIKVEGNPEHPSSLGATNAFAQAAILELYDPDRSKEIIQRIDGREEVRSWAEFSAFAREHFAALKKTGGAGFRVLSEASSSPTLERMRGELLKQFPQAKWYVYEPVAALEKVSFVNYCEARVILCLDADILGCYPGAVNCAQQFATARNPAEKEMVRLYVAEPTFSMTGAAADHRLPIRCQEVAALVRSLKHEIEGLSSRKSYRSSTNSFIRAVAKDLFVHARHGAVVVGARQPPEVHSMVAQD